MEVRNVRNAFKILVGNSEEQRFGCRQKDNIEMDFKEIECGRVN